MFTNPVWTVLIAWAALGETVGYVEMVAVVVSLAGVSCIARPTFLFGDGEDGAHSLSSAAAAHQQQHHRHRGFDAGEGATHKVATYIAVCVGLFGAVSAACAYVIIRKIRQVREKPLVSLFVPTLRE
jgi:drug/metabolite transporter (DMT)-like permease